MGLFEKLLKDGADAAATVLAHVAVTGAEVLDNAEKKREDLGRKFDARAQRAAERIERTRDNLAQAVGDHLNAFAEALDTAMTEAEREHRAATAPQQPAQPQATVSEATPDVIAQTKPGLKKQAAPKAETAPATPAATPSTKPATKPRPRKRGTRQMKKP